MILTALAALMFAVGLVVFIVGTRYDVWASVGISLLGVAIALTAPILLTANHSKQANDFLSRCVSNHATYRPISNSINACVYQADQWRKK